MAVTGSNGQVLYTQQELEAALKLEIGRRYPDARGNTPADNGQIVYDERGLIVREAFGRPLSKLETALCDALDDRNAWVQMLYSFAPNRLQFETILLDTPEKVQEYSVKMNQSFRIGDQVRVPVPEEFVSFEERQPRTMGHGL